MASLVWARNAMACRRWEAGWEWRRFEEGSILAIRPTVDLACMPIRDTEIVRYQLVSSIKKARPSFWARPYDIHNPIKVIPMPASADSMTYVRLLPQTFPSLCEGLSRSSLMDSPSRPPAAFVFNPNSACFATGNTFCFCASATSIKLESLR